MPTFNHVVHSCSFGCKSLVNCSFILFLEIHIQVLVFKVGSYTILKLSHPFQSVDTWCCSCRFARGWRAMYCWSVQTELNSPYFLSFIFLEIYSVNWLLVSFYWFPFVESNIGSCYMNVAGAYITRDTSSFVLTLGVCSYLHFYSIHHV